MQRSTRIVTKHDPAADLTERWPEWMVHSAFFMAPGVGERFDVERKIVFYASHDHEWATAHVLAHLDLGHHLESEGCFKPAHEADADLLASIRLDLLRWTSGEDADEGDGWDDVPMDGDPTVRM